jgi:hypothetical protein
MKRVCSWCNQEMAAGVPSGSEADQVITHGICEICAADVLTEIEAVAPSLPDQRLSMGPRGQLRSDQAGRAARLEAA